MRPLSCSRSLPGRRQHLFLHATGRFPMCRLRLPLRHRRLTTLAIETSCDDTAVAVLRRRSTSPSSSSSALSSASASPGAPTHELLFNERKTSDHRATRGIEPLAAVQGHHAVLGELLRRAVCHLEPAPSPSSSPPSSPSPSHTTGTGIRPEQIIYDADGRARLKPDFVTVTRGPGIAPNLAVGLSLAKGAAAAWGVPLVAVHHMQAHALTPRLVRALGKPMLGEDLHTPPPPPHPPSSSPAEAAEAVIGGPDFPFLSLLVSGGHTQLLHSSSPTSHRVVASTADAAVGNALDHAARLVLPPAVLAEAPDVMYARHLEAFAFPRGGEAEEYAFYRPPRTRADDDRDLAPPPPPEEEDLAAAGQGWRWSLPQPFRMSRKLAFSFSALGSTIQRIVTTRLEEHKNKNSSSSSSSSSSKNENENDDDGISVPERRQLARYLQAAAFQHIATRTVLALEDDPALREARDIVVAGGVACNRFLPHVLRSTLEARGFGGRRMLVPPPRYCTDNAAMIAYAGMVMWDEGWCSGLDVLPLSKWPMDPAAGPGILGVPGWLRRPGF